jgi:hypothetical protein
MLKHVIDAIANDVIAMPGEELYRRYKIEVLKEAISLLKDDKERATLMGVPIIVSTSLPEDTCMLICHPKFYADLMSKSSIAMGMSFYPHKR